jgi:hypothetical protein
MEELRQMSCPSCHDLNMKLNIGSPSGLQKAIRIVQANLADGTLEPIHGGVFHSKQPFMQIAEAGPWDDHMFYEFRCRSCFAGFSLSVETYHGVGGLWGPCGSDKPA